MPVSVQFEIPNTTKKQGTGITVTLESQKNIFGGDYTKICCSEPNGGDLEVLLRKVAPLLFDADATTKSAARQELVDGIRAWNVKYPHMKIASVGDVPAVQVDNTDGERFEMDFNNTVANPKITEGRKPYVWRTKSSFIYYNFNEVSRKPDSRIYIIPYRADEGGTIKTGKAERKRFSFNGPVVEL